MLLRRDDGVTVVVFFFSSRRRHTRLRRDWSSDVCSSDLKDQILTLTTTDMELEISASNKIQSTEEVSFTIYAKDLIDIVRRLPEKTQIKFRIEEKKIYLNANNNTFELNTFNHLDFPALPKTQDTSVIKIKQDDLKTLIENRSEEHTSELQSRRNLVCRLLLEKKKQKT